MVDGGHHLLQGDVAEQVWHRLAIMSSPDGLREDHGDVNNLETEKRAWCYDDGDTTETTKTHKSSEKFDTTV